MVYSLNFPKEWSFIMQMTILIAEFAPKPDKAKPNTLAPMLNPKIAAIKQPKAAKIQKIIVPNFLPLLSATYRDTTKPIALPA